MTQYRITSSDFVTSGENGDLDACLSPEDLAFVRSMSVSTLGMKILDNVAREKESTNPEPPEQK